MTRPLVLGFGGKLRHGKDAASDRLVDAHGFVKFGMSDPLLRHILILDPWIPVNAVPSAICPNAMEGTFVRASELVAQVGYVKAKENEEFRRLMLKDGTEGGRDFHHEDIWADKLVKMIEAEVALGHSVALTGIRFMNELAIPQRFGGRSVWVERPGLDSTSPASNHVSENSVTASMFDHTILNDGTLEDLHKTVDTFLERTFA